MAKDFYETLGVARGADADALKKAYRKLAMQYHPDKNPGDKQAEQKFKEINEAYDVLKDEQKRAAYDRFGSAAFQGGMGGAGAGGFDFASSFSDIFEDLFSGFAGAAGRGRDPEANLRGADLRYNLRISLEDAFKGNQQTIKVSTSGTCDECSGSGGAKGTSPVSCPTCSGTGRVRMQQGFFTMERPCHTCTGSGKIIKDPCKKCAGSGRVRKEKTLSVNVPAGVEDGTRIRLSGEGEAGMRGGPAGDLYIFVSIAPHQFFKRDGANIHCRIPIPFTTAALGGSIEAPTLGGGRVKITIPEGTQNGHQFKLKGKGMSVMRANSHGDMFVHVAVETPVHLNKQQKELLKEFAKISGSDTSPESSGFFSKVKDFWEELKE